MTEEAMVSVVDEVKETLTKSREGVAELYKHAGITREGSVAKAGVAVITSDKFGNKSSQLGMSTHTGLSPKPPFTPIG